MRRRQVKWMAATAAAVVAIALGVTGSPGVDAQSVTSNPFRPVYGWGELPQGRTWGSTSVVDIARDGKTAGDPPQRLTRPSDVLVVPSGEIYIVEAHDQSRGRVTKWAADGTYLETWGEPGYGPKQFHDPHALAMDSQGRIFVGDRFNNRIQIFDQKGTFLASWTQFGRPSGIFIDANDVIYVADSESSPAPDKYQGMRNAGWEKGIRIGDAKTGWVRHFIPDDRVNVTGYSGPEGIAADAEGNVYGAEVTQRRVVKWVRFRP